MNAFDLVGLFAVAFAITMGALPLIRRIAFRYRFLDMPDGVRRIHSEPIPRLGGIGVLLGFAASIAVFWVVLSITRRTAILPRYAGTVLIGCAILFLIGLVDDLKGVKPSFKLIGQTAAALVIWQAGFSIPAIELPGGYVVSLGWLALPITLLWLVGVSNAFNLVDGMDGLAASIAIIAAGSAAVAATVTGRVMPTIYAAALAGALFAFLRRNFPPAKIFLGDSGSLVIGYLLAVITVRSATQENGTVFVLVPLFALAYPLLDTAVSMLRRFLRGDPLSRADGRHIHHQLRNLGLAPRRALGLTAVIATAVAVMGLSLSFAPAKVTLTLAVAVGAALLMLFVYGIRWLEYHELLEAGTIVATAVPRARGAIRDTIYARDVAKLISNARSLTQIDSLLEHNAPLFRFSHMQIGPAHARLRRDSDDVSLSPMWKFEYPVVSSRPHGEEQGEVLMLTIWCAMNGTGKSASAERVAQVLAPAIADWVRLGITPTSEIRARARRSSGSYRAITNAGMSVAHQSDAAIS